MALPQLEYRGSGELEALRNKVAVLESEVAAANARAESFRRDGLKANAVIENLRKGFDPVYGALRQLYGEMDKVDGGGASGNNEDSPIPNRLIMYWNNWKQKLPGKRAEFIQAFLDIRGEANFVQVKAATRSGNTTVTNTLQQLKTLGLVVQTGRGRYRLKEV